MAPHRIERVYEGNEVTGNEPGTLVNELIERVLTVGSRLAPVDGTGRMRDAGSINHDVLPVALHGQLLQVRREPLQILFVWQHRNRFCPEKVGVPDAQQRHQHREIALEWRGAEVLVHLVEATE